MATTSLWRVNGWLGKVVIYVENPDKTENPSFFEKPGMSDTQMQGLSDVIEYAANQEKTQMEYLMATGQLDNPALLTIASTKAQLSVDLLVNLRNKSMESYNELMRISSL